MFQSLTRDSNHSNFGGDAKAAVRWLFQSLTRDSNHSNNDSDFDADPWLLVSIPHAG